MNHEKVKTPGLNKLREEAIKFLSDKRGVIITEDEIAQAVQLMLIGYSIAVDNQSKQKSLSKTQNLNRGIIMSEWGQDS